MSKVSVIVPIYNVEKYIEKCLKSLCNQTLADIEILAISDGTPDNSMEIVEKYAKKDKRIKPIYKENGGYGSVLEYGINVANSEYFLVCDPDDWLENNALEILLSAAEKEKVDLVIGDKYNIYVNSDTKEYSASEHQNYKVKKNVKCSGSELNHFSYMKVSPHSKLFKTEIAKQIVFPYKISYTDNVLYLVYLNNCHSALYIPKALSYYLLDRPGNTANEASEEKYKLKVFNAMDKVFNSIYEQVSENINYEIANRIYIEERIQLKKIKKLEEVEEYEKCLNKIIDLLLKLRPFKNDITKNISGKNILKKYIKIILINLFYFNLTRKIAIKFYQSNLYR